MRPLTLYRSILDRYAPGAGGDPADRWLGRAFYAIIVPAAVVCAIAVAVSLPLLISLGKPVEALLYVLFIGAAGAFVFARKAGLRAKALGIAAAFHAYGVLTLLISGPAGGSGVLFSAGVLFCALFAGRASAIAFMALGLAIGAGFGLYWDASPGGGMLGALGLVQWLVLALIVTLIEVVFLVSSTVLVRGVRERARQLGEAEAKLRAADEQREALVRELFHRSKNNLQVVSSLIRLHSAGVADAAARGAFRDIQARILAMALVQRKLFESRDLARVGIGPVVRELAESLHAESADPARVRLHLALGPIAVPIDLAVPLALAASEIITNALMHAFPPPSSGTISAELSAAGAGGFELSIADDGVGFARGFDPERDGGVGLRSVFALARDQIGGSIRWESGKGVRYILRFEPSGDGANSGR